MGFHVKSVTRDGSAETFALERMSNGVRVRIGSAGPLLPRGQHTYVIRYRTTPADRLLRDFDELYWNATGTGWSFPDRRGGSAHHAAGAGAVPADRASTPGRRAARARTPPSSSSSPAASSSAPRARCRAQRSDRGGRLAQGRRSSRRASRGWRIWLQDNPALASRLSAVPLVLGSITASPGCGSAAIRRAGTIIPLFASARRHVARRGALCRRHGVRRRVFRRRHHRPRRATGICGSSRRTADRTIISSRGGGSQSRRPRNRR